MPGFQEIPPVWAPGATTTGFIATVATTVASAAVQIRPAAAANTPLAVMLKASILTAAAAQISGFTLTFGDASVAAPADTDMILDATDGWVQFMLPVGVTHFRIKSPASGGAAGTVRGYLAGRPS